MDFNTEPPSYGILYHHNTHPKQFESITMDNFTSPNPEADGQTVELESVRPMPTARESPSTTAVEITGTTTTPSRFRVPVFKESVDFVPRCLLAGSIFLQALVMFIVEMIATSTFRVDHPKVVSFVTGLQVGLEVECIVGSLLHIAFGGALEGLNLANERDNLAYRMFSWLLFAGTVGGWLGGLVSLSKNNSMF
ncbi:hypothetical protein MMC27_002368 [Xylographa pallens]|nr:hypothetical protein [Xylographa pallens]